MSDNDKQKKAWVTPVLRRMRAGDAEAGSGQANDGSPGSTNKRS